MAVTRVTEKKLVRIVDVADYQSPIALEWLGPHGDFNQWVFAGELSQKVGVYDEVITKSLVSNSSFRPYDLEYIEAFEKALSKKSRESIDVVAPDVQDYYWTNPDTSERELISERETLKTLVKSPYIKMLINPITWDTIDGNGFPVGPKWMRVFIDGSSFSFGDKGGGHYSLSFTIIKQPDLTLSI